MNDSQVAVMRTVLKIALTFVNGFAGILAAYPGPELPAMARLLAAATVCGCGAVLLILAPPGAEGGDTIVSKAADELERRRRERVDARLRELAPAADPLPPTPRYPQHG